MSDPKPSGEYQVLARKYRPQSFDDIIGQDAMVKTLRNAFATNRVAHAFMLTGVRGIGKTTTARLLARALNYETDDIAGPSVDFPVLGKHCADIMASSHMDVLEMDAASRTGVENMREMLDGVRYAPVDARYKVYIIDEVHMLSTGAFNALLKTLEEPPDHAKFIFATTEIRKVPITVLSRCQRFDLRRVDVAELSAHLKSISEQEDAKISDDGLALIARAAEGSVRDGLSLLDQAIVQRLDKDSEVSMEQVRDMLGLADRVRVLDLFGLAALGDAKGALTEMRAQYDHGADPVVIMRDMLDLCHEVSRAKAMGDADGMDASPDVARKVGEIADALTMGQATRLWQMLLKAYKDTRLAPDPLAAAEMALLRLCVAAEMPPPELAAKLIADMGSEGRAKDIAGFAPKAPASDPAPQSRESGGSQPVSMTARKPALESEPEPAPTEAVMFNSLEDIANHAEAEGSRALRSDIETCLRLVSFAPGKIVFEPAPMSPPRLPAYLKEKLKDWTGQDWSIVIEKAPVGTETIRERRNREVKEQDDSDRNHPDLIAALNLFKGAQLVETRERAPKSAQIIAGNFGAKPQDDHL
ncbi:DNA polymerase III subunit gamma/tau [Robiginitomaculum antarcticum]|uniref:DNA polymerase III subunit gamma/tau n=1 Tax=Robiginitomaculum antarcticum TaxID=437507 RepID=UPI00036069D6|nr:DNA polymerase III subunit gamma/tau [Robiginitomaculum antarcticum]